MIPTTSSFKSLRQRGLTLAERDEIHSRAYLSAEELGRLSGRIEASKGALREPLARAARTGARSAPLVLIEEHLTVNSNEFDDGSAFQAGRLVRNWHFPQGFELPEEHEKTPVLKIQPFKSGGYEASLRMLDLRKIARAIEFGGRRGERLKPDELDPENVAKASLRAKAKMRMLVKNMGATNLGTLNRREGPNTKNWKPHDWQQWELAGRAAWEAENGGFWSSERWAQAWDQLRRLTVKAMGEFPYVAILEKHRKGNYHLHVAWVGKIPLNIIRPLWWHVCGGRGQGNVDAQYIKAPPGQDRSHRIAAYISKYVGKHFEDAPRFNKKRYWASRQSLEEAKRYVMRARAFDGRGGAFDEMFYRLGLNLSSFQKSDSKGRLRTPHLFLFPGGDGCWLSYLPDIHALVDPPF